MVAATTHKVVGGRYPAEQHADGTWTIHGVRVFTEIPRGENGNHIPVDAAWHQQALDTHAQMAQEQFLPPVHIYHHDPHNPFAPKPERAGLFNLTGREVRTVRGKPQSVLIANLERVPHAVFQRIEAGEFPYVSVETPKGYTSAEILSCALLDSEPPYCPLPLLSIGNKSRALHGRRSAVAGVFSRRVAFVHGANPGNGQSGILRAGLNEMKPDREQHGEPSLAQVLRDAKAAHSAKKAPQQHGEGVPRESPYEGRYPNAATPKERAGESNARRRYDTSKTSGNPKLEPAGREARSDLAGKRLASEIGEADGTKWPPMERTPVKVPTTRPDPMAPQDRSRRIKVKGGPDFIAHEGNMADAEQHRDDSDLTPPEGAVELEQHAGGTGYPPAAPGAKKSPIPVGSGKPPSGIVKTANRHEDDDAEQHRDGARPGGVPIDPREGGDARAGETKRMTTGDRRYEPANESPRKAVQQGSVVQQPKFTPKGRNPVDFVAHENDTDNPEGNVDLQQHADNPVPVEAPAAAAPAPEAPAGNDAAAVAAAMIADPAFAKTIANELFALMNADGAQQQPDDLNEGPVPTEPEDMHMSHANQRETQQHAANARELATLRAEVAAMRDAKIKADATQAHARMVRDAEDALAGFDLTPVIRENIRKVAVHGREALTTFVETIQAVMPVDPPQTFGEFTGLRTIPMSDPELADFANKGPEVLTHAREHLGRFRELQRHGRLNGTSFKSFLAAQNPDEPLWTAADQTEFEQSRRKA